MNNIHEIPIDSCVHILKEHINLSYICTLYSKHKCLVCTIHIDPNTYMLYEYTYM